MSTVAFSRGCKAGRKAWRGSNAEVNPYVDEAKRRDWAEGYGQGSLDESIKHGLKRDRPPLIHRRGLRR